MSVEHSSYMCASRSKNAEGILEHSGQHKLTYMRIVRI